MSRPLTAAQLADALGYFSNTVISAMHHGTATEACIAQGIDAVAGRLEEIGGPPPSPELEMPKMLVLSTSHITKETDDLLTRINGTEDRTCAGLPTYYPKTYYHGECVGWIFPLVQGEVPEDPMPADLRGIFELAAANGCTWIMLDRDAEVVDGLPAYEW